MVAAGQAYYIDEGLQTATSYTYRVRSYNTGSASAYTAEAANVTLDIARGTLGPGGHARRRKPR